MNELLLHTILLYLFDIFLLAYHKVVLKTIYFILIIFTGGRFY